MKKIKNMLLTTLVSASFVIMWAAIIWNYIGMPHSQLVNIAGVAALVYIAIFLLANSDREGADHDRR